MQSAAQLSTYIVAFAGAARTAQKLMSTGMDPMTISEYYFEVNLTADFNINSVTDVGLTFSRITLSEKLTLDYKEHMGITVKCTIKPAVLITAQATGGGGGGGAA